jgi:hypothetical protein
MFRLVGAGCFFDRGRNEVELGAERTRSGEETVLVFVRFSASKDDSINLSSSSLIYPFVANLDKESKAAGSVIPVPNKSRNVSIEAIAAAESIVLLI